MPSSRYDLIPLVLDLVTKQKPKSILDVGIGFGKWGVLFREYLDIWDVQRPYNLRDVKLYGVEVFKEYKTPVWEVYDKVFTSDILTILPVLKEMGNFDLLFLGDVIEHLTKEEGQKVLAELSFTNLIIITPKVVSGQEKVYGNSYEIHKSSWTTEDFPNLNHYEFNNQQVFWK